MLDLSLIIPLHNEARYLPYCLKGLLDLPIKEIIFILDNCKDKTEKLIDRWFIDFQLFPYDVIIRYINKHEWKNATAELFDLGFRQASGSWLMVGAGDLVYNKSMFDPDYFKGYNFVSWFYYTFDLYRRARFRDYYFNFAKKYLSLPLRRDGRRFKSGVYAIKKDLWVKHHFQDVLSEDDDLYFRLPLKDLKENFVFPKDKLIHLRTQYLKDKQILKGKTRARYKRGLLPVALHSILYFKPYLLASYLKEREPSFSALEREIYEI